MIHFLMCEVCFLSFNYVIVGFSSSDIGYRRKLTKFVQRPSSKSGHRRACKPQAEDRGFCFHLYLSSRSTVMHKKLQKNNTFLI